MRIAVLLALLATLVVAAPGSTADQRRIASYCSPSGDVCYGIFGQGQTFRFELTTAARYFNRYKICVKPPTAVARCKSFPVRRRGQVFGGVVVWNRNYPNKGPGRYTVTWQQTGQRLGPSLRFRVAPLKLY